MSRKFMFLASLAAVVGLVPPAVLPAQESSSGAKSGSRVEVRVGGGASVSGGAGVSGGTASGSEKLVSPSESNSKGYWLGLMLDDLNPIVKDQLGLKGGATVVKIMPDSPAAKVELKPHDIILSAGDQAIEKPSDMQKALAACKGNAMELAILRGGVKSTVEILPELTPEKSIGGNLAADKLSQQMLGDVRDVLKKFEQDGIDLDLDIDLFGPAIIVESQAALKMPEDLSISITKNGNDPARISVKQQDKSWDITEDKIDELPEELRPHVRSMLGNKISFGEFKSELPGDLGEKIKEKIAVAKERASAAREALKERGTTKANAAEINRLEAEMKKLQEQLQKLQRGATSSTSLRSPSEQQPTQPANFSGGGASAAAFSEGISISDGNGTRTQTRSGVKISK